MTSTQPAAGRPVIRMARWRHGRCLACDAAAVAVAVVIGLGVAPMAVAHLEEQALPPQRAQDAGDPPVPLADALIGKWDVQDNGCTESFDEYRADGTMRIADRTGDRWDISALRPVGRYSLDGAPLTTITDRPDGAVIDTVVETIRAAPQGLPPNLMRLVPRRLGFTVAIENFPTLSMVETMMEMVRRLQQVGPLFAQMRFQSNAISLLEHARFGVRFSDLVLDAPAAGIDGEAVFSLDPESPSPGGGRIDLEIRGLDSMTETARAMGASKQQLTALELLTAFGLPIEGRSGDYRYGVMLNTYIIPLNFFESVLVNDRDITPLLDALQNM